MFMSSARLQSFTLINNLSSLEDHSCPGDFLLIFLDEKE